MAQGNNSKLQLALETVYAGTGLDLPVPDKQVRFSSESFKYTPSRKEEGLLTGGNAKGRSFTMASKTEGDLSTTVRPDEAGYWLALALGVEDEVVKVAGSSGAWKHTFKCISGADQSLHLPSAYFVIDRVVNTLGYLGCKVDTLSFSAAPEDYLTLSLKISGRSEVEGELSDSLLPSPLKAFRFSGGTVKMEDVELADVTSIKFDYNNSLESNLQTTSTGVYYKEPEVGAREIKSELEALFTAETVEIRNTYFKGETELSLELLFESEELIEVGFPYSMNIILPHNDISDSSANVGGAERLKQTFSLDAFESEGDELITVELINGRETPYIESGSTG